MNVGRTVLAVIFALACRVELGPPGGDPAECESEGAPAGEVWVYTSMYQSVVDDLTPLLRAELPDVEVKWYRAGSEKVAQRAEAEWSAGGTRACLLMTSDPFWYADLAEKDRLETHFAPNVLELERAMVDPAGRWATARLSLMVLARNETALAESDAPATFAELTEPQWSGRITMGDPLSSGTMFTTLAFWQHQPGWDYVRGLRDNGLVAAGGNSSVLTRVETGERAVGVLLLENLLTAAQNNSPAKPVFPADGAIAIPGPIALTTDCANKGAARAVYDLIQSPAGQRAMVAGQMYAALPGVEPPDGAPPLHTLAVRPWSGDFLGEIRDQRGAIKERWASLISGD